MSYICHRGWIPFFLLLPARWPLHRHLGGTIYLGFDFSWDLLFLSFDILLHSAGLWVYKRRWFEDMEKEKRCISCLRLTVYTLVMICMSVYHG